jgi:hypothetical protein
MTSAQRVRRAFVPFLLALFAWGYAPRASAEPSEADRDKARRLMIDGDALAQASDYAAALPKYEAADALMTVPTTGLAVARTQAALGKLVEARDKALQVSRLPEQAGEPGVFRAARQEAAQLAASLEPRIPSLRVVVEGAPAGTRVRIAIDGREIPPAAAKLPRKLNPGKHTVVASADGYADAREELSIAESAKEEVTLRLSLQGEQAPVTSEPITAETPEGGKKTSSLVYIGFGIGAAGIVAGSVAGYLSMSKTSDIKDGCNGDSCPAGSESDADSARTLAWVSNIGFGVGVIGIGIGIYGLVSSGGSSERPPPRARAVQPVIGARYLGLQGSF